MMSGRILEKPKTSSPILQTEKVVSILKQLPDGWGGEETKKPTHKAVRKTKKVLSVIETAHMPWPGVSAVPNGGIILTWNSLTRDALITIDFDGDMQFTTSLKKIDRETAEVLDRLDSEGCINDMLTLDQILAWFCLDKAKEA